MEEGGEARRDGGGACLREDAAYERLLRVQHVGEGAGVVRQHVPQLRQRHRQRLQQQGSPSGNRPQLQTALSRSVQKEPTVHRASKPAHLADARVPRRHPRPDFDFSLRTRSFDERFCRRRLRDNRSTRCGCSTIPAELLCTEQLERVSLQRPNLDQRDVGSELSSLRPLSSALVRR